MNNPDFSQSPEHVALAKAMRDAWAEHQNSDPQTWAHESWLPEAEAAVTFFGSGYRLPEATEANAERLAREYTRILLGKPQNDPGWVKDATNYLSALRAAFGEPDKPEQCNCADCSPANWPDTNGWRCGKKKPEKQETPAARSFCDAHLGNEGCQRMEGHAGNHASASYEWPQGTGDAPDPNSPADPTVCRPGCDRKFGHLGPHSDEMQEEIIPRCVLFTALASNAYLMERLIDLQTRSAKVAMIREWASIFEEAACRK